MNIKATNINFGENLRKIREKKGYTQESLAEICGFSRRMISHYERQVKRPSLDKVKNIANALNISIDELMGDSDTIKKNKDDVPLRILKKLRVIEKLPTRDQNAIYNFISLVVEKNKAKGKL